MFNFVVYGFEEFDIDFCIGRIIFDKEYVWFFGILYGVWFVYLSCSCWCCWVDKRLRNRGFG